MLFFVVILLPFLLLFPSSSFAQAKTKPGFNSKAAEFVIQGSIYELNGQYEKALNSYNEALIYEPESGSICFALAKTYVLLGKVETAEQMLVRSLKKDVGFVESRLLLAQIYYRKGSLDEAVIQFEKIVELAPENIDAHVNLGAIYLSQNKHKKAAEHYEVLVKNGWAGSDIKFQLGNLYFQSKDFDSAYATFKGYALEYPDLEQGYLAVGAVLIAQEDTTGAIEWYTKSYDENSKFRGVWDELANLFVTTNNWDEAASLYESAIEQDSSNVLNRIRLGDLYIAKGDTASAIHLFEELIELHPEEWRGPYKLGMIFFNKGEFKKSALYFEGTVKLNKVYPDPWFRMGLIFQQDGDLHKAEENYREAQRLAPAHPGTNFYLGNVLLQKKEYWEAIEYLEKSLKAAPDNSLTLSTIAAAYDEISDLEKSEFYYLKALEIDPENPTVLNNYGYSLAQRGENLEVALKMVESAIKQEPENGAFLDTIGWVFFKLGNYDKAIEFIEKALAVRDGSAEVYEHLGDVYHKLGELEVAHKHWQQAKDLEPDRQSVLLKLGIN